MPKKESNKEILAGGNLHLQLGRRIPVPSSKSLYYLNTLSDIYFKKSIHKAICKIDKKFKFDNMKINLDDRTYGRLSAYGNACLFLFSNLFLRLFIKTACFKNFVSKKEYLLISGIISFSNLFCFNKYSTRQA